MPNNQFKTFADGGGANVLTQAAYEALTSILNNGFGSGILPSDQLNKVLRQATVPAGELAQFISDILGEDVLDNGDTAALERQIFRAALNAPVFLDVGLTANTLIFNPGVALTGGIIPRGTFIGRVAHTNTSRTVSAVVSGGTPLPVFDDDGNTVQIGVLQTGRFYSFSYDGTGLRVAGTAIIANIVGPTVGVNATLAAAGTSITFTAVYANVATVLGGLTYTLNNINSTLNVATVGAGGMDIGLAPVSGFVSIYLIYNPVSRQVNLLGTTASQSVVYGGANMPAGYTASGLLSVWPTDGSRQLIPAGQVDKELTLNAPVLVLLSGISTAATAVSLASAIPVAARTVGIVIQSIERTSITTLSGSALGSVAGAVGPSANTFFQSSVVVGGASWDVARLPIAESQTIYYSSGKTSLETSLWVELYGI